MVAIGLGHGKAEGRNSRWVSQVSCVDGRGQTCPFLLLSQVHTQGVELEIAPQKAGTKLLRVSGTVRVTPYTKT